MQENGFRVRKLIAVRDWSQIIMTIAHERRWLLNRNPRGNVDRNTGDTHAGRK